MSLHNKKLWSGNARVAVRALALAVLLAVGALGGGCGSKEAVHAASSNSAADNTGQIGANVYVPKPPGARGAHSDRDRDSAPNTYYDHDDDEIISGHVASAAEQGQVGSLVSRYYAAAATGDGPLGCSLLYSLFAEAIVENHGEGPDTHVPGNSCPDVLSRVFKTNHRQVVAEDARLRLMQVKVEGVSGSALLDTGTGYPHYVHLHRESGIWKLESVLASELG